MIKRIGLLVALLLCIPVASAQGALSVGFAGNHASRGTYVDVTAIQALSVTSFAVNLAAGPATITVYTKAGPAAGSLTNPGAWTQHAVVNVTGNGQGTGTGVAIPAFAIPAGQTYAFYLVADTDGKLFNAEGDGVTSSASNASMSYISAYESHGLFSITYTGWPFQGTVCYNGGNCGASIPVPPTPEQIPTLSEWALIAMSLLVVLVGLTRLRRGSDRTAA